MNGDNGASAVLAELEEWAERMRELEEEKARTQEHIDALIRGCRARGVEWKVIAVSAQRNMAYLAHKFSVVQ